MGLFERPMRLWGRRLRINVVARSLGWLQWLMEGAFDEPILEILEHHTDGLSKTFEGISLFLDII